MSRKQIEERILEDIIVPSLEERTVEGKIEDEMREELDYDKGCNEW